MTAITFQNRVQPWLLACFGAEIAADKAERNHRFLEESLELVQSCGCTASEAHQLVDYVFGRPVGEPAQEAGGVMVTLAALCLANSLDMHEAGETELARIWTKVEAIRAKQAAKPKHSPLPAAPAAVAPQGERQWICPTRTVADLVNNLLTMDQGLPVYGAQYIEKDGRRCAIAVPPTVSRERVLDGRWIGQGEELNAAVVWTRAEQPAAVAGPALDVTLDEDQAGLLRDMLGDPAEYPEAITVRLLVGDGHSGHGLYVAQAEYQDEGAVLLSSLPAPAAPALEAPAAPGVPAGFALVPIEPTQQMLDAGRWSGAGSVSIQEEWARKEVWSRMLATITPPPAAYTDDLVALVENLAQALSAAAPGNDLAGHALDYLERNGLQGSPLQAAEAAPQAPAGVQAEPVAWMYQRHGWSGDALFKPAGQEADNLRVGRPNIMAPCPNHYGWTALYAAPQAPAEPSVYSDDMLAAPAVGNWIAAEEVDRLVRDLEVALHGEADAAPQASLCDIVGLAKAAADKLGRPVLAAPAAPAVDASDTSLLDAMERERIAVIPEFEGPWDAQIFGEDEATLACGSGVTPRKAIAEALASLEARKAHDAAQAAAKGGGIVSKTERLGHANALIEIISRHGRRFFRNRESGAIARLELDASGRLWWIDEYRGSRVYTGKVMGYPHRWRGFSHGGTLRSLVEALRGYVLRGELLHPEYIAPSRIDPTNGDIWGYGAEAAAAVRAEAHALPLFQRPTGHKEST